MRRWIALLLALNVGCAASVRTRSGDGYSEQRVFRTSGWFLLHAGAALAVGGSIAVGVGATQRDGETLGIGSAAIGVGLVLIGGAILWRSPPDAAFRGPPSGPSERVRRDDDEDWMKEGDALAKRAQTSSAAIEQGSTAPR